MTTRDKQKTLTPADRSTRLLDPQDRGAHAEPDARDGSLAHPFRSGAAGGLRVAYSYLVGVMAGLLGGGAAWGLAAWLYSEGIICGGRDGFGCPVLSFATLALVMVGLFLVLGAWWARLGWLWVLWCLAGVLVVAQIAVDPGSWAALLVLAVPLVAALVTDPTSRGMSRRRRWITAALGAGILLEFVAVVGSAAL